MTEMKIIIKKRFWIAILILAAIFNANASETDKSLSNCYHQFWVDYYNEMAETMRLPCIIVGIEPPFCQGYCNEFSNKITHRDDNWEYLTIGKGKNNDLFTVPDNNEIVVVENQNDLNFFYERPVWQDVAGGKQGIYDADHDILVFQGTEPQVLKDGYRGIQALNIFYEDKNGNNRFDSGEKVWRQPILPNRLALRIHALREKIYKLLQTRYVNHDLAIMGSFSDYENIPFALQTNEDGTVKEDSVKLFPDRAGQAAFLFTKYPTNLLDGTKLADQPVYFDMSNYSGNWSAEEYPLLPVHFEEIRQVLNLNLFKWSVEEGEWNPRGENNYYSGSSSGDFTTWSSAYSSACSRYEASLFSSSRAPYKRCYGRINSIYYYCTLTMQYSYLEFEIGELPFKYDADFYNFATRNRDAEQNIFNQNNDDVIENKWCRYGTLANIDDETPGLRFPDNSNLPFKGVGPNLNSYINNEYQISDSAIVFKWDAENSMPKTNIEKRVFIANSLADTNRDDLVDIGFDTSSLFNETGSIVYQANSKNPQVFIPLRISPFSNGMIAWEYLSQGGIDMVNFFPEFNFANYDNHQCHNMFYASTLNLKSKLAYSGACGIFIDVFVDEAPIHVKRYAVLRPRGQIVVFDFPYKDGAFSKVGTPIGMHSKRTYRLIEFSGPEYQKHSSDPVHYGLQFDSGIIHVFEEPYNYSQSEPVEYIRNGASFANSIRLYEELNFPDNDKGSCLKDKNILYGIRYNITFELDGESRLTKLVYQTKDELKEITVTPAYNENGEIIKLTKKLPDSLKINDETDCSVSVENAAIHYPNGSSVTRTEANGKVSITRTSSDGIITTDHKFNDDGLVTELVLKANDDETKTTFEYYDDDQVYPNTTLKRQKLKKVTNDDGSWSIFEYDENGWTSKIITPFKDSDGGGDSVNRTKNFSYVSNDPDNDFVDENMISQSPRMEISKVGTVETGRSYHSQNFYGDMWDIQTSSINQVCSKAGAAWDDPSNLVSKYENQNDFYFDTSETMTGELNITVISRETEGTPIHPNGESFISEGVRTKVIEEAKNGTGTSLRSTETLRGPRGEVISSKTIDTESGETTNETLKTFDSFGRVTTVTHMDKTSEKYEDFCLYGAQRHIGRNGDVTEFNYGSNGLMKTSTINKDKMIVTQSHDAMGNVIDTVRIPSEGEVTTESSKYDAKGRQRSHTTALGETKWEYKPDGSGHTVTYPDGKQATIVRHLDGTTKSISGKAARPVRYEYGVHSQKGLWTRTLPGEAGESDESTTSYQNILGQQYRTETSTGYWTQTEYDEFGRAFKYTDSENSETTIAYNEKNEVSSKNQNGKITEYKNYIENGQHVSKSTLSDGTENSMKYEVIQKSSFDGKKTISSVNGRESSSEIKLLGDGVTENTTITFDGKIVKSTKSRNSIVEEVSVGDEIIASVTANFDDYGRTLNTSDHRGITSYTYRNSTSQPLEIIFPNSESVSYTYEANSPRPTSITTPNGDVLTPKYSKRGDLEKLEGTAPGVLDASHSFDERGRKKSLVTDGATGSAKTNWLYNSLSGQLAAKEINKRLAYQIAYNADGSINALTKRFEDDLILASPGYRNAPSSSLNGQVSKLFNYSQDGKRLLTSIEYTDNLTPKISISGLNLFNQPKNIVTEGVCSHEFTYNANAQTKTVKVDGGKIPTSNITYDFEEDLKKLPLRKKMSHNASNVTYEYDFANRLLSVKNENVTAIYEYLNSKVKLVKKISIHLDNQLFKTRNYQWDTQTGRLLSLTNKDAQGAVIDSFQYKHNPKTGKVEKLTLSDNSFWSYSYDERGQLKKANHFNSDGSPSKKQVHSFQCDSIANVLKGGKLDSTGDFEYKNTSDLFNQINLRINGSSLEVIGSADPETKITINNITADRDGDEFSVKLTLNNIQGPVKQNINIVASKFDENASPTLGKAGNGADIIAEVNGYVNVPKAEEKPIYDLGGRISYDSQFQYSWDAESRLIKVEPRSSDPNQVEQVKVENIYDHAGRRIIKKVYSRENGNWTPEKEHYYSYDSTLLNGVPADFGLLIAETVKDIKNTSETKYQYLWGVDVIAGATYQGAGGVDGLIAVIETTDKTKKIYVPTMDAMGSVHKYIEPDTNEPYKITAQFEYSPFGEITSQFSPDINKFTLRFQTKQFDPETNTHYYGLRHYNPKTTKWLSSDPLEEAGGLNLYAFVNNDPINYIDYLGMAGYFFDGTGNHPHPLNLDGTRNYKTNVRILFESYIGDNRSYAFGIGSGYQADGTENGTLASYFTWHEGATGRSMENRVEYMMGELRKNLLADDKVVDLVGFSRGAASATMFLNRIQEKIKSGDPLYKGIEIRFVALFDQVPSRECLTGQVASRSMDTLGYLGSLTFWNPDTYANNASITSDFKLPRWMKFTHKPLHLVSLDEQRKEFACSDLVGARQVGFRGVHSNVGGGYGGSLFEFIAREFVIESSKAYGLNLFMPEKYMQHDGRNRKMYNHYMKNFAKGKLSKIHLDPTDNSDYKFNDNEPRHLPAKLEIHPSVHWFAGSPYNSIY